jgi:hypothetical protein
VHIDAAVQQQSEIYTGTIRATTTLPAAVTNQDLMPRNESSDSRAVDTDIHGYDQNMLEMDIPGELSIVHNKVSQCAY